MDMKARIKYSLNNETKFVELKVQAMLYDAVQSALHTALPGSRMLNYTRVPEPVKAPVAEKPVEEKPKKEPKAP
jgi:hypothetical protein